jgi:hypothetical protein
MLVSYQAQYIEQNLMLVDGERDLECRLISSSHMFMITTEALSPQIQPSNLQPSTSIHIIPFSYPQHHVNNLGSSLPRHAASNIFANGSNFSTSFSLVHIYAISP